MTMYRNMAPGYDKRMTGTAPKKVMAAPAAMTMSEAARLEMQIAANATAAQFATMAKYRDGWFLHPHVLPEEEQVG